MDASLLGGILGLLFNIFIQVLILRWITVKVVYNGDKDKITNGHYVFFVIIAGVIYVLLSGWIATF